MTFLAHTFEVGHHGRVEFGLFWRR
jgi:hypothetical protein